MITGKYATYAVDFLEPGTCSSCLRQKHYDTRHQLKMVCGTIVVLRRRTGCENTEGTCILYQESMALVYVDSIPKYLVSINSAGRAVGLYR